MNSRILKNKIAVSCNGNLKKYFRKVELINKFIIKNKYESNSEKNLHKVINN